MAAQDLMDALIADLGTAQPERDDTRLRPESAPLDDRDTAHLLDSLRMLAPLIRHYAASPDEVPGNWSSFFPPGSIDTLAALVERIDGKVAPHQGLLITFLRLLARPQARLNRFTAQHLNFQMQRVLGFVPTAPQPDHAHLVFELKKGAAPLEVGPKHRFSAGKDATKVEQLFAPLRSTLVGRSRVARLATIVRQGQRLHFAPVADSADGLGAALAATAPHWPPFGRSGLPAAPVGFAVASPLLRLAEGERRITLKLRLSGLPAGIGAATIAASFDAHLSGPKGWIGPLPVSGALSGNWLTLTVIAGPALPAVVDHDPAVHLHAFPAVLPVIQCLLKAGGPLGYDGLDALVLQQVQVGVQVIGMRGLVLESDEGTLDPKKAFLPFGGTPVAGSRFHIGCAEALNKPVSALKVKLNWQGAPPDLLGWYHGYAKVNQMSNGIAASVSWRDASGAAHNAPSVTLLPRFASPVTLDVIAGATSVAYAPVNQLLAMQYGGSASAMQAAGTLAMAMPVSATALTVSVALSGQFASPQAATPRAGFVTVTLIEDLLHGDFAGDAIRGATPPALPIPEDTPFTPTILNAPYTPKVQEITLDYSAESDTSRIDDAAQTAFTNTAVQFFQIDALGPAREQAWLNVARTWAPQGGIGLLPPHPAAAELWVGLEGAQAGDSVSLLFQVAEGTADPLAAAQKLEWSVLADNAWRKLDPGELVVDGTRSLRASGLLSFVLPRETTTTNTRAPAGLVWLRATTPAEPRAACDIVGVFANAAEVVFVDQDNDAQRLGVALPAASITKLKTPLAGVKSVAQPYASFGGALQEDDAALSRRAAERLRQRNRAITGWDVERLVLQNFPSVYRAKCIPHASESSWLAAGHLMVVVVPDLRNRGSQNPLQPRVDLDTLERIKQHLAARCGPQTKVHVRNPGYRPVQLDFKMGLRKGSLGINFDGPRTNLALQQALSPWAFDTGVELGFGGRVVRSELLDFVESLPWVDFVTDFRLTLEGSDDDRDEIVPDTPDAILVSAAAHKIMEVDE